mmetsp:Transcript_15214/g.35073  ORF Transcript_15214/g.35073 Transcript_15214/m.35073 type:complete len:224 (-) Transcript_15214:1175-1846(-)
MSVCESPRRVRSSEALALFDDEDRDEYDDMDDLGIAVAVVVAALSLPLPPVLLRRLRLPLPLRLRFPVPLALLRSRPPLAPLALLLLLLSRPPVLLRRPRSRLPLPLPLLLLLLLPRLAASSAALVAVSLAPKLRYSPAAYRAATAMTRVPHSHMRTYVPLKTEVLPRVWIVTSLPEDKMSDRRMASDCRMVRKTARTSSVSRSAASSEGGMIMGTSQAQQTG